MKAPFRIVPVLSDQEAIYEAARGRLEIELERVARQIAERTSLRIAAGTDRQPTIEILATVTDLPDGNELRIVTRIVPQ